MKFAGMAFAVAVAGCALAGPVGDAAAGQALLKSQQCLTCHRVGGEGGTRGPALSRMGGRTYTPAEMAGQMWNHAPAMWSAMEAAKIARPAITTQGAADLFAYFYMARFFETRGDAGRGRRLFKEKGCEGCHLALGPGPEMAKWQSVGDPIELARQMWNHGAKMNAAMKERGGKTPQLSAQEMNDIAIYASGLARGQQSGFATASPETGEVLFKAKGCAGCHTGANAIPKRGSIMTTADLAASMWNHSAQMKQTSALRPEEMKRIVGYLWAKQFEQEGGDTQRGAKVWQAKGCQGCHGPAAPKRGHGEEGSSYGMVAVLWRHGPAMLKEMKAKGVNWPVFAGTEMTDLIAYFRSK